MERKTSKNENEDVNSKRGEMNTGKEEGRKKKTTKHET
jgi:hypothetical protein